MNNRGPPDTAVPSKELWAVGHDHPQKNPSKGIRDKLILLILPRNHMAERSDRYVFDE